MVESAACSATAANHVGDLHAGKERYRAGRTVNRVQVWIDNRLSHILRVDLYRALTRLVAFGEVVQTVLEIETQLQHMTDTTVKGSG